MSAMVGAGVDVTGGQITGREGVGQVWFASDATITAERASAACDHRSCRGVKGAGRR